MLYCSRKVLKTKLQQNETLIFYQLKNLSSDVYKETLKGVSFPNHENLDNTTYKEFIARLYVHNVIAPFNPFMHNVVKWPNIL